MSSPPYLTAIERPRCSRCQRRMILESVSPGPVGFEHRLFECPKCNEAKTVVVASDPFNSKAAGWLSGELGRRPTVPHEIKNGRLIPKTTNE
jgi:hypothetical protein